MSQSPKSKFALHIMLYLNAAFLPVRQGRSRTSSPGSISLKGTNCKRKSTFVEMYGLRSLSRPLLLWPSLSRRNPQALRWKPGDWHDAKKKKHEDPDKHGRNTVFPVFLSSIQRRIKIFGNPGGINQIRPTLISKYHITFNQAFVTVKKNRME